MLVSAITALLLTANQNAIATQQKKMVDLIRQRGITNANVLQAMGKFPRHELVPESHRHMAYDDRPLPIGHDQTISQPYIVAFMSEAADVQAGEKVLEIGTGSGYQAAILALMGARVFTIEIVEPLAKRAEADLKRLNIKNVRVRAGDGFKGWPEEAPFDAIVVTAAPPQVPPALFAQLAEGGRLVIPVGPHNAPQTLKVYERRGDEFIEKENLPVRFVPMTGKAQQQVQQQPGN